MLYRVALALGKTVRELSQTMEYKELAQWMAFFKVHGYPDARQEFYGAQLASLMLSVVSKKSNQYKTGDFMLDEILTTDHDKDEATLHAYLDRIIGRDNAK